MRTASISMQDGETPPAVLPYACERTPAALTTCINAWQLSSANWYGILQELQFI